MADTKGIVIEYIGFNPSLNHVFRILSDEVPEPGTKFYSGPPADAALADALIEWAEHFDKFNESCDGSVAVIMREAAAVLRARAVPDGMVLVPVEPTREIRAAMHAAYWQNPPLPYRGHSDKLWNETYAAMLAASKGVI